MLHLTSKETPKLYTNPVEKYGRKEHSV